MPTAVLAPMRRIAGVSLAIGLLATPGATQQPELSDLGATIIQAMKDWRAPGLAIAVVKNGEVVFAHGYGVRELGKPHAVDTHTLFAIGSTTKAMTAALIGMLVDDKKIAWDDPVIKHVPWLQLKDPLVTRELTVRDLLTHRGSLGNADYLWYGQTHSTDEILRRVRLIDPAYSLRSRFIYQNVMYAAAGEVIKVAGGMSWADMIRTRIFEPLGMNETLATAATLSERSNVASPHATIGAEVRVIENASVDSVAAAGSVWSSVGDMAKWMQFLLDGGRVGGHSGKRLLSEATVAQLFKPQTIVTEGFYPTARLTNPKWITYGLGWFQHDYRGRAIDFHTGSIDGMVAIHGLIRDDRLGVFVLSNLDSSQLRHALMYTVFDRYIGGPGRNWSADLLKLYADLQREADALRSKREGERTKGTTPSLALDKYVGTYTDPLHGDVIVSLDAGSLRIQYGSGFVGPLEHWHHNTFRARWRAEWRSPDLVNFVLDARARPSTLELRGARFARSPQ